MVRWYCAYTAVNGERLAKKSLEDAGFQTFLPFLMEDSAGKKVLMFPRYIFIRFDADVPGWQVVCRTRGIEKLLGAPVPTPLPMGWVHELKQTISQLENLRPMMARPRIPREGEEVTFKRGPFEGMTGICQRSSRARVLILLSAMTERRQPTNRLVTMTGTQAHRTLDLALI